MSWQGNRLFSYRFNSRTRVGATYMRFRFLTPNKVSIHAPVWVRLGRRSYSASGILFQFTHPCGCDIPSPLKRYATLRFNSRTRVGATFCQAYGLPLYEVSIHAPVWVRRQKDDIVLYRIGFNSRTRVGATPVPVILLISGLVSIHAPVWVRQANQNLQPINNMFQFTHPCGCDLATPSYVGSFSVFQFTHPCGCDGRSELSPGGTWSFNSRTRVGATPWA